MKQFYVLVVFLFTGILYSQNGLEDVMKKYANKDWYYLTETNKELVLYRYCTLLSFTFTEKEIITKDTPYSELEKFPVDKILYDEQKKSLDIYSVINGVTQKGSITHYDENKIKIDFVYYVATEGDTNVKRQVILTNKKGFKKVKNIDVCDKKNVKIRKLKQAEEPPPPPR